MAIDLPEAAPDTRSTIVVVTDPELAPAIFANDTSPLPAISARPGAAIFLLEYHRTLDELFLTRGRVDVASTGATRPLPTFDRGFATRALDGGLATWLPLQLPEETLAALRIKAPDFETCIEELGCMRPSNLTDELGCYAPCEPAVPEPPEPPAPVDPPRLMPCLEGWSAERDLCVPPQRIGCGARGLVQWVDRSSCEPLGVPCPIGQYPEPPPGALVYYVLASATPGGGGTGTIDDPFLDLAAAAIASPPGAILALSKGEHRGGVVLGAGVELRGACVEETTIDGSIRVAGGAGAAIRDLLARSISVDTATLALESAIVDWGIDVRGLGAVLTATAIVVRNPDGDAIAARDGAIAHVRRALIGATRNGAIASGPGSLVTISEAAIAGTFNAGAYAHEAGRVIISASSIRNGEGFGLLAHGFAAKILATDTIVQEISPAILELHAYGCGAATRGLGRIELIRALLSQTTYAAACALSGTITLLDTVLQDTKPGRANLPFAEANGVVINGGSLIMERSRVERIASTAVQATGSCDVSLRDVQLHELRRAPGVSSTAAIIAAGGAALDGERIELSGFDEDSFVLLARGGVARLADVRAIADPGLSMRAGVAMEGDAELELERAVLAHGSSKGIYVFGEARARLSDVRITGFATGMTVLEVSTASIARTLIERSAGVGMCLDDDGSVYASDFTVEGSTGVTMADVRCSLMQSGNGISVAGRASLAMREFAISAHAGAGLTVTAAESLDIREGVFSENPIGARVFTGFPVERRWVGVRFEENQKNIEFY